ncbi:MAG: polyprenyl synthetase family protein [Anaerolineae bacterium]|nr:polyprenyl synthetase family protein [Anaerolineae bacterium]MDW8068794.1 polyprenyl synthetase family protein [Anaerolineae bacterium]
MTFQEYLDRYLPALEAEMQAIVATAELSLRELYGMLRYHLGWEDRAFRPIHGPQPTGKRIRPVLCLLCCEACGGDWERALPAAAAVELVHNFSLIHDDIEDGDTTRRGRPTLWSIWGMPQALNAGDTLFTQAHLALFRLADRGVPPETVLSALQILLTACQRLTEGQFLDLWFEGEEEVSVEDYLWMIARKTAALLSAACELGALVAGAPADVRERLRTFGYHAGIAFQIQDDILGLWGDPAVTGKPVGSDLRRGKKTFPVLYALGRAPDLRHLLSNIAGPPDTLEAAMALLSRSGAREAARARVLEEADRALQALREAVPGSPAANALADLVQQLAFRDR